jgi:mannitol/fructose-specific phosphotransferase system IIA component (Ntr-type)
MNLHFDQMQVAGVVALAYFLARATGKLSAANLSMRLAGATERVRRFLGFCLIPQAGLTIGLVFLIKDDPLFAERKETVDLILAVLLTVVTLNEIVGPLAARAALVKAGETGMDRTRLLDFIQEENIVTDLRADTKQTAIEQLVDHMIRSHHLDIDRSTLLGSVLGREAQASTCLGGGLAVPHAILPEGHAMVGVMGLSSAGLDLKTPDGGLVHCMVLLATSPGERDRHLQVLATLARTIGLDPAFQDRLFHATSPAHASEILHGEESHDFNYFLDGEE